MMIPAPRPGLGPKNAPRAESRDTCTGGRDVGYVFGQPWLLTDSTSGIQVVNINAVYSTSSSSARLLGEPGTWKASFLLLARDAMMPSVLRR